MNNLFDKFIFIIVITFFICAIIFRVKIAYERHDDCIKAGRTTSHCALFGW